MKKIKSSINQKDRIICVTEHGYHEFYYQPAGTKKRTLIFDTNEFSGSVFAYFRDKGRSIDDRGFSLTMTIKELYEFKQFHNVKLSNVINRIPVMINHVLSEQFEDSRIAA